MSNKGLRFFGTNYNSSQFGNAYTASSLSDNAQFAFDGLVGTKWISSGENTDGNAVYLECDYGFNRTFNCFYCYGTNIDDIKFQYWNGASFTNVTISNATIVKSSDESYIFAKLNTEITTDIVRIVGSNTITANQEKYVTLFFAFSEIGQFQYFPDFKPSVKPKQNVFETTDGRSFVIERGEAFSAKIEMKSHVNQNDIDLAEELLVRREPFHIWPNGGNDSIFRFSFRPFRFQDLFKVTIVGNNSPEFTKNYYKAGYNNTLNIVEVV